MKNIYVQKQVIGWEEFRYSVPDDFEDYKSLINNSDYVDWQYLEDSSEYTGDVEIYNEDWEQLS